MAVGPEAAGHSGERDADVVDLDRLTGWLGRKGWRRPVEPAEDGEPATAEQLALFGAPEAATAPPTAEPEPAEAVADTAPIARDAAARLLVTAAVVAYVALLGSWTMRHHDGMGTQAFDLGLYDQGVWLLSRFKEPFVTLMGRNLFGDHTSFILLPLVPFYWVWPTAKVLLLAQAAPSG